LPLRWMDDGFALDTELRMHAPQAALLIGGGYIDVEMADALTRRGLAVTVVEHGASILKTVESNLGQLVQAELRSRVFLRRLCVDGLLPHAMNNSTLRLCSSSLRAGRRSPYYWHYRTR